MIKTDEIKQKSEEFKIPTTHVEKDYVYGWLLKGIFSNSSLSSRLILKGGNALRKGYLNNTRFSKDLDFSIKESIEEGILKEELNKVCQFVESETGIEFDLTKTLVRPKDLPNIDKDVLEARTYFKGFYGEESIVLKTQVDVTQFDNIVLPVQSRSLIHPYSDSDICSSNIVCQKLEEILASKINTLLQRRKVADLFDLSFSLLFNKEIVLDRKEVITTFLKKSLYESNPDGARSMLLSTPLNDYEQNWATLIVPIVNFFTFNDAASGFNSMISSLFSLVGKPIRVFASGFKGISYFSSEMREVLFTSSRSQKMVEMVYDNYPRLIEPYELEYKIRQSDGRGVEYLWGWDNSGGKSGKQGIKMFICDKIQSMHLTEHGFIPRFPILI
ncbi:MAG: nucleotidyl transferase AbiEii/AbiGii toxin family protein [Patescibacteria group bacterium]|nr:nucleotidyl transferase AbiEii/AbiGii toxin family protein [Patescibacteria group bacterium]